MWRPKHQVLINHCYPRLPSNSAADVRANSSELSYLIFYASTRRSKLLKVGTYLERTTLRDVHKQQSARVLVTLHISTALLENKTIGEASGMALIAPSVMRILSDIIANTNDISLIEASQHTWHVFCKQQNQALLAADHEYRELFEKVVAQYAQLARKIGAKKLGKNTQPVAVHDAIRLREIGLSAIKSVIESDAIAYESGRQLLSETVPAILGNLRSNDAQYLNHLISLSKRKEENDTDKAIVRRQSMATVRTHTGGIDAPPEADPRAAEGTAQDADKLAEEEVAILALDSLKAVFTSDNRAQARTGATAVLEYLSELQHYRRSGTADLSKDRWAVKVFELCTEWTPVQDRFILMVTAIDMMLSLPINERGVREQLMYASLIDHVFCSDLNLIGLSIMDVLLNLSQQYRLVVRRMLEIKRSKASEPATDSEVREDSKSDAAPPLIFQALARLEERLGNCIIDLAIHVYYTDQISDMARAILARVKPSPEESPSGVAEATSNTSPPQRGHRSSTSGYFSSTVERQAALSMVEAILRTANSTKSRNTSGGVTGNRSPVHISIWEGTQWLLSDPSPDVRMAYYDALITWTELETTKSDFQLHPEDFMTTKEVVAQVNTIARRAVSNASATKDRAHNQLEKKASQQTFLQLLHLANYDNAIKFASTSEMDIRRIDKLLILLTQRLGKNCAIHGIPMYFRLQEEIDRVESPLGRVRLGTLSHGYFWAVVDIYGCQDTEVGREISGEIERRKERKVWLDEAEESPPSSGERDSPPLKHIKERVVSEQRAEEEELKPFTDRAGLVDAMKPSPGARALLMHEWSREGVMADAVAVGAPESVGESLRSKAASQPHRAQLAVINVKSRRTSGSDSLVEVDGDLWDGYEMEGTKSKLDIDALLATVKSKKVRKIGLGMKSPPY